MVSHELSAYTMNRHMKNATQNITVLKPRPSWNRRRIGALPALSSAASVKTSPACARCDGTRRDTTDCSAAVCLVRIR
ncbi:hypothetical protein D3C72_1276210 [compost metagenome]